MALSWDDVFRQQGVNVNQSSNPNVPDFSLQSINQANNPNVPMAKPGGGTVTPYNPNVPDFSLQSINRANQPAGGYAANQSSGSSYAPPIYNPNVPDFSLQSINQANQNNTQPGGLTSGLNNPLSQSSSSGGFGGNQGLMAQLLSRLMGGSNAGGGQDNFLSQLIQGIQSRGNSAGTQQSGGNGQGYVPPITNQQPAQQQQGRFNSGQTYIDGNGNRAVFNNGQWQVI